MNSKAISELRRRFSLDNTNFTCIRGCYVDDKKQIASMFVLSPMALPQEEHEVYLSLLKKVLSGMPDKNLTDLEFPAESVGVSDEHKLLTALKDSSLNDDDMAQVFFQRIIDSAEMEGSYLILLAHDAYDIFVKNKNGETDRDLSNEMFKYIVCALCPLKLTKPSLSYSAADGLFHLPEAAWAVAAPDLGFVFPAFEERAADIYRAFCYVRDVEAPHEGFITGVFGAVPPMAAPAQQDTFRSVLQDTLADECSLQVVQSVHDQLREKMALQKAEKTGEPLRLSAPDVSLALQTCGVEPEKVEAFRERYNESFGSNELSAVNVMDVRQFEVRTPNVVIKVDPEHSDLVETRIINGNRYILIRAEEGVEVNGVNISIQPE